MPRPPIDSRSGRETWLRDGKSEPRPLTPLPFIRSLPIRSFRIRSAEPCTFPPDCGVKCRQPPSLVEVSGLDEFPGRGTFDIAPGDTPKEWFVEPFEGLLEGPFETPFPVPFAVPIEDRFIAPSRCTVFVSENRRQPELSEAAGRPIRSLLPLAPRSACCAPVELLNAAGVRTPDVGLAAVSRPAPAPAPFAEFRLAPPLEKV